MVILDTGVLKTPDAESGMAIGSFSTTILMFNKEEKTIPSNYRRKNILSTTL